MTFFNNYPAEILILLFLTVTFLQSGIDKIVDWKGNLGFITGHFKHSPLGGMVPLLLGTVLVLEIASGVLMLLGIVYLATTGEKLIALIGIELAAIALICLLLGQRLAKDYAGAMTLAVYFIIAALGVYLLNEQNYRLKIFLTVM